MDREKVIYLIRHGESEGNISPFFQSTIEPLSIDGLKQAKKVAKKITDKFEFNKVISSPLNRTRQTAEEITKITGGILEFSDLLVEVDTLPELYGKPIDDPYYVSLSNKRNDTLRIPNLKIDGVENFEELMQRVDKTLDFLKNDEASRIVAVTHGFFLRAITSRILLGENITPELFWHMLTRINFSNTGITTIKYETLRNENIYSWRVISQNDHSHLI